MKKVQIKKAAKENTLSKKALVLFRERWIYLLLFICFTIMFKPVVTEMKFRAELQEKTMTSDETDFLPAMPFPLLPALQVSENSIQSIIRLCVVCGKR
jgi:hypothetical protein